ncbi:MAG TPA: DUF5723 family protein [Acidobacteriota bacterium]|nr:DUF5723 family protein [Acidobacteriota bacterium]
MRNTHVHHIVFGAAQRFGWIGVAVLLGVTPASATTPLATATAGSDLALACGIDAVFGNPAHLGMTLGPRQQLRLFSVAGGLHSNSLGWSQYREYNGATLTADDKSDILDQIPSDGLTLSANGSVSALALRLGSWAVTTGAVASARGQLDHDAIELLLYGNASRADWVFDQSDAEGFAAWQIALSHGRRIGALRNGPVYAGITLAYIRGLYYVESSDVYADLETESDGLSGGAAADWLTAEGGSGWGLDLGVAWQPNERSIVSLKLENLIHTIRWSHNVELTHYTLQFDDLTIDNFDDSLWVSDETTEAGAATSAGLPPRVRLGWARHAARVNVAVEVSAALAERFAVSTTPRLASAVEYTPWSPLHLRSGLAVGGATGFAVGWGLGLDVGPCTWSVAVGVDKGLWIGSGNGMSAATSLDLNF